MINWMFFPKSAEPRQMCTDVVTVFQKHENDIASDNHTLHSDSVLCELASDLESLGFRVERGKKKHQKVSVPVLFGLNPNPPKDTDGRREESGRGVRELQGK